VVTENVVAQPQARPSHILLEICLDSVDSAVAAERKKISVGLQVMIRPRGGDFCYTPDEFSIMQRDILIAKQLGANGVVLGMLDADGNVDQEKMRQLVELARPLKVTCHRAIDMSRDLLRAARDVIDAGAHRILTSGGEKSAVAGLHAIAQLVQAVQGRIPIMACGEISSSNVQKIVEQTNVREVHAGLGEIVPSTMRFRNHKIAMGSLADSEYQRKVVSESSVRDLRTALERIR
jgi:copper homeostasis protein